MAGYREDDDHALSIDLYELSPCTDVPEGTLVRICKANEVLQWPDRFDGATDVYLYDPEDGAVVTVRCHSIAKAILVTNRLISWAASLA